MSKFLSFCVKTLRRSVIFDRSFTWYLSFLWTKMSIRIYSIQQSLKIEQMSRKKRLNVDGVVKWKCLWFWYMRFILSISRHDSICDLWLEFVRLQQTILIRDRYSSIINYSKFLCKCRILDAPEEFHFWTLISSCVLLCLLLRVEIEWLAQSHPTNLVPKAGLDFADVLTISASFSMIHWVKGNNIRHAQNTTDYENVRKIISFPL